MSKISVGQTKLTIKLNINEDLTDVTTAVIKYKNPNGEEGQFSAVKDISNSLIYYVVDSADDIDIYGDWIFWAHLIYTDGKVIAGESKTVKIYKEGT